MTISLPETLPSLDEVDPKVAQFYDQGEDGVFKLRSIEPLVNAMKNAKQERAALAEQLKDYKARADKFGGVDLTKYNQLLEREQQLMDFEQTKGLEIDRIKGDIENQWKGKLTAAEQRAANAQAMLENRERNRLINDALSRLGANEMGKEFLPDKIAKAVTFEQHGDDLVPKILDRDGKVMLHPETFDPMTIDDLIAEQRKKAPGLFRSDYEGRGGSGTNTSPGTDAPPNKPAAQWSFQEIKAYDAKHGAGAAARLLQAKR